MLLPLVGDEHHLTESSRGACERRSGLAVGFICGNKAPGTCFTVSKRGTQDLNPNRL